MDEFVGGNEGAVDTQGGLDGGSQGLDGGTPAGGSSAVSDITDDTLVRVPGQKDPVKYGELYKRLQGDYTRKTQQAAAEAAKRAQEYERREREIQQREQQLREIATNLTRGGGGGQNALAWLEEVKNLPYLDGQTAYQLLRQVYEGGLGGVNQQIQQRDQVIGYLYKQLGELTRRVQGFDNERVNSSFDSKIRGWVKELDLPEAAVDLAKEIYLAYEGNDLDQEFPTILKNRWEQINQLISSQRNAAVEKARAARRIIPGKGGQGVPGKGIGLKGNESAKEVADKLWESFADTSATRT